MTLARPGRPISQALPTGTHLHVGRGAQSAGLVNTQAHKTNPFSHGSQFPGEGGKGQVLRLVQRSPAHRAQRGCWQELAGRRSRKATVCQQLHTPWRIFTGQGGGAGVMLLLLCQQNQLRCSPEGNKVQLSQAPSQLCSTLQQVTTDAGRPWPPSHTPNPAPAPLGKAWRNQRTMWGNHTGFLPKQ